MGLSRLDIFVIIILHYHTRSTCRKGAVIAVDVVLVVLTTQREYHVLIPDGSFTFAVLKNNCFNFAGRVCL